ncbi:MAG TPA: hypothetical protein VGD43_20360 [Micromonospora sp.]
MPDKYADPSGNTEAFRAFAKSKEPTPLRSHPRLPLIIGFVVVDLVVVALVLWYFLG